MSHLTDEMRAAVGAVVDWRVSYPVSESDIRRWAIAVYHPDPPPSRFLEGQVAPEEFNPFAWAVADRMVPAVAPELRDTDRNEKAIGITGPGLAHQVNGGTEVTYDRPVRAGDVIRSETRLVDYREREGRLGLMLITVLEATWTDQHGRRVQIERQTSIRY